MEASGPVKGTDIFPRGTFDGPWAFLQKRPSVHANSGLRGIIEAGIDYENLEDAPIPIEVVTTSLTDGRERWIGHGPAVDAILASSAIPPSSRPSPSTATCSSMAASSTTCRSAGLSRPGATASTYCSAGPCTITRRRRSARPRRS